MDVAMAFVAALVVGGLLSMAVASLRWSSHNDNNNQ